MDAATLHCPNCGAAVSQNSPQCPYCQALLQTVACPKCMGMMFAGSKFCPHCGANTASISRGDQTRRQCPRCHVNLQDVDVANNPLEECPRCGGLWIDVATFHHLCSDAEAREAASGLRLPPPVPINTSVRYLPCPTCAKLMNRMNYAERSGIVIDVCRSHGIWLDRDEIRHIVEFISSGGLARARQLEKEELAEARREQAFEPVDPGGPLHSPGLHESLNSDQRNDLLKGIASLANHFLGDHS